MKGEKTLFYLARLRNLAFFTQHYFEFTYVFCYGVVNIFSFWIEIIKLKNYINHFIWCSVLVCTLLDHYLRYMIFCYTVLTLLYLIQKKKYIRHYILKFCDMNSQFSPWMRSINESWWLYLWNSDTDFVKLSKS